MVAAAAAVVVVAAAAAAASRQETRVVFVYNIRCYGSKDKSGRTRLCSKIVGMSSPVWSYGPGLSRAGETYATVTNQHQKCINGCTPVTLKYILSE
jgi:hypothetical protein